MIPAKKIVLFLLSCLISYLLFYSVTSKLIFLVYQGEYKFELLISYIVLLGQTILLFSAMELLVYKKINVLCITILWILYFVMLPVLLFGRKTVDNSISLDITQIANLNKMNVIQMVLNYLFFMPFGYLLRNNNVIRMSAISLFIILCIEVLQMITHRGIFDIVDIIIDYLGVFGGFLITKHFMQRYE